jgi:hypothetical protein
LWLFVPCPCAAESEDSTSESNSQPNTLALEKFARSCTSKGKHMRPQYWRSAWAKESYLRPLSGLTLPPSQMQNAASTFARRLANTGSISGSADSRASRSPLRAARRETGTSVICGPTLSSISLHTLLVPSSWKTCQASFLEMVEDSSGESLTIYTDWVTGWRRSCSKLGTLARATVGSGCSSSEYWTTPTVTQIARTTEGTERRMEFRASIGRTTLNYGTLEEHISHWATPRAFDAMGCIRKTQGTTKAGYRNLPIEAQNWAHAARSFSPPAHATTDGPPSCEDGPNSRPPSKRRLNPAFASWLMGWHPAWVNERTSFAQSGTEWYRYRQRLRSCCFGLLSTMLGDAPNS